MSGDDANLRQLAEQVLNALAVVESGDAQHFPQANAFLLQLQSSEHAWHIALALLEFERIERLLAKEIPSANKASLALFAASTLRQNSCQGQAALQAAVEACVTRLFALGQLPASNTVSAAANHLGVVAARSAIKLAALADRNKNENSNVQTALCSFLLQVLQAQLGAQALHVLDAVARLLVDDSDEEEDLHDGMGYGTRQALATDFGLRVLEPLIHFLSSLISTHPELSADVIASFSRCFGSQFNLLSLQQVGLVDALFQALCVTIDSDASAACSVAQCLYTVLYQSDLLPRDRSGDIAAVLEHVAARLLPALAQTCSRERADDGNTRLVFDNVSDVGAAVVSHAVVSQRLHLSLKQHALQSPELALLHACLRQCGTSGAEVILEALSALLQLRRPAEINVKIVWPFVTQLLQRHVTLPEDSDERESVNILRARLSDFFERCYTACGLALVKLMSEHSATLLQCVVSQGTESATSEASLECVCATSHAIRDAVRRRSTETDAPLTGGTLQGGTLQGGTLQGGTQEGSRGSFMQRSLQEYLTQLEHCIVTPLLTRLSAASLPTLPPLLLDAAVRTIGAFAFLYERSAQLRAHVAELTQQLAQLAVADLPACRGACVSASIALRCIHRECTVTSPEMASAVATAIATALNKQRLPFQDLDHRNEQRARLISIGADGCEMTSNYAFLEDHSWRHGELCVTFGEVARRQTTALPQVLAVLSSPATFDCADVSARVVALTGLLLGSGGNSDAAAALSVFCDALSALRIESVVVLADCMRSLVDACSAVRFLRQSTTSPLRCVLRVLPQVLAALDGESDAERQGVLHGAVQDVIAELTSSLAQLSSQSSQLTAAFDAFCDAMRQHCERRGLLSTQGTVSTILHSSMSEQEHLLPSFFALVRPLLEKEESCQAILASSYMPLVTSLALRVLCRPCSYVTARQSATLLDRFVVAADTNPGLQHYMTQQGSAEIARATLLAIMLRAHPTAARRLAQLLFRVAARAPDTVGEVCTLLVHDQDELLRDVAAELRARVSDAALAQMVLSLRHYCRLAHTLRQQAQQHGASRIHALRAKRVSAQMSLLLSDAAEFARGARPLDDSWLLQHAPAHVSAMLQG